MDELLRETISGKWVKVQNPSGTMLLELPEEVLISIHPSNSAIHFYLKDDENVYQYAGDLSFKKEYSFNKDPMTLHIFSPAMSTVEQRDNATGSPLSVFLGLDMYEITKRDKEIFESNE